MRDMLCFASVASTFYLGLQCAAKIGDEARYLDEIKRLKKIKETQTEAIRKVYTSCSVDVPPECQGWAEKLKDTLTNDLIGKGK
jgi:hypothetical protein